MLSPRTTSLPAAGGELSVDMLANPAASAGAVVVLVHDLAANSAFWGLVRTRLGFASVVIAADIRGRAASASLPGPFGMDAHVADILAMLDALGVDSCMIVGHGYGAHIALNVAARFPTRVGACVLLGSGAPAEPTSDPHASIAEQLSPVLASLRSVFASRDDAVRHAQHLAAATGSSVDVLEAATLHDLQGAPTQIRRRTNEDAVWFDGSELILDPHVSSALYDVACPVELLAAGASSDLIGDLTPTQAGALERHFDVVSAVVVPSVDHNGLVMTPAGADAVGHAAARALRRWATSERAIPSP